MIDNRKEQERAALHSAIWQMANDLRGSVDGWDFKQYVLGMIFYRFLSERFVSYINEQNNKGQNTAKAFDYASLTDEEAKRECQEAFTEEKGYFILPSQLFDSVQKRAAKDENLNETLQNIFQSIERSAIGKESESDIKGLFDDIDVNSSKLGATVRKRNELLFKLINAVSAINFGNYADSTIDGAGDAYEYLMGMYASSAGKSGGEFFTPQEVSELLANLAIDGREKVYSVYDPACGSGSLLLKFTKMGRNVEFYGQEINLTTYNLCRMNMFLHGIDYDRFEIEHGDTLTEPYQHKRTFDAIVSNPPYSTKWNGDADQQLVNDPRFSSTALAPRSKADLAFVMHSLSVLKENGTAAIVCFPGVLYRAGAEQKIRKYLIECNHIDAVIQLPSDLFFGTSIGTCILVLKKNRTKDSKILFIDASAEFIRVSAKNKLTTSNIEKIVQCYNGRTEQKHFSRLVECNEVAENSYNVSVSAYVEKESENDAVDIIELNAEIAEITQRQAELRAQIDAIVAKLEGKKSHE
ncbi:putative type I restriction enzyme M protein [Candidatus Fokinia solitaria]|uniref:site-specific DNA-methyltransferase (adenine-specific) n=1 Tax=Candidatus Fokinia solitaria TaxID=1802984 RepID=A0A2U8BSI9_9RICK|nr:type I restriction-modification system subunit M [Candidatus Fokinia solitaria]AWD33324.1 putative type I restriction enzyme M protein [Candidatus Fokinia solitaria]